MTLIDLGKITHDPADPALPVNHRRVRHLVLAAAALAGVLLLTGSARPAPPSVQQLWAAPLARDDTAQLHDGTAYVNRLAGTGTELTAYDLATGEKRWRVVSGTGAANFGVQPAVDVVLVPVGRRVVDELDGGERFWTLYSEGTVALDAGTGRERWRTAGEVGAVGTDGTGLVLEHDRHGVATRIRLIRLGDGHQVWELPASGAEATTVLWTDDQPLRIATVTAGGELRVYGYADGRLRARARVPWKSRRSDLMGAGALLAVRGDRNGTTTLYRPDDLSVLWSTGDVVFLTGCGRLLCALDDDGVAGRDPATGRELWRVRDMFGVAEVGPGRLLLDSGGVGGVQQLVDAGTGRPIGSRAYGVAVPGGPAGSLLLLRRTARPPGGQLVSRLDLTSGEQTALGLTAPADEDRACSGAGRYLACERDGALTVVSVG
jgi:outer membrane protein assembly factor BamB